MVIPHTKNTYSAAPTAASLSWRKFLKLRYLLLMAVLIWAIYEYLVVLHPELVRLQAKSVSLQTKMTQLTNEHASLNRQIANLNNRAYIDKYATEHYNLTAPGQVSFEMAH